MADRFRDFTSGPSTRARHGAPSSLLPRCRAMLALMMLCGSEAGAIITGTPLMNSQRSGWKRCHRSNASTVRGSSLSGFAFATLQHPLGARHLARAVLGQRVAQCQRQGFERGLGAVVVVLAAQHVDVERHPAGDGERLEEVGQVLGRDLADHLAPEAEAHLGPGPAREVDHGPRQRLVERRVGVAETADAATVAERSVERLAERQRAVLGGVVVVDLEVALAGQLEVEPGVLGQAGQHVVEEAEPGLDLRPAVAVEGEADADRGLVGAPLDGRLAPVVAGQVGEVRLLAHGTICAISKTTMSVPPRSLTARISAGRSARGTAAFSAKPASWCSGAMVGSRMLGSTVSTSSSRSLLTLSSTITRFRASSTERARTTRCSIRARFSGCSSERSQA